MEYMYWTLKIRISIEYTENTMKFSHLWIIYKCHRTQIYNSYTGTATNLHTRKRQVQKLWSV